MKSITKHLTPKDFYAQIRMERQRHKGAFLLMEGSTDIRRFEKFFIPSKISIITCWGKENVIDTISLIQDRDHSDCIGFIDADFDRLLNDLVVNHDIISSEHHDFDLDICRTDVIRRYLNEVSDCSKLLLEGGCDCFVESILHAIRPLSAMRFANQKHRLGYSLKSLCLEDFFDGNSVDMEKMINVVSNGRFSTKENKDSLRSYIKRYVSCDFDLWQLTNGHDFITALGITLRKRISSRSAPQTWRQEVEKHLRLSFDYCDFYSCYLSSKINSWQAAKGFSIIKQVVFSPATT